jgi:ribonuclease D
LQGSWAARVRRHRNATGRNHPAIICSHDERLTGPDRRAGRPVSAPATIVVDPAGLEALVDEVAAEDSYGFDTEFHTERTYVPDLALIQIAWADKTALVDPLAVDPAPLARVFGGGGVAVAHAASQDLDVLMAACGAIPATVFDTQIVAGFLGLSTPSLSRLVDQMLGVSLPKADRLSDWLVRPISDPQVSYALNDVAHLLRLRDVLTERLRALGRLEWALDECDQVLGDRTPARVPEEAWWKLGDIRGMSRRSRGVAQEVAAWRERTAAASNRPRRMVLSDLGLMAISQRPPRNGDELRGARGVDGRHLAQGRTAEILQAVERGLALPQDQIRMPTEGRDVPAPPAAVAVCSGLVRQIADDLDFDQGLLATRADIAQLLIHEPSRLDTGWRRTIVGDPLRRLIAGEVAAAFDRRGHLVIEERSGRAASPPAPPGESDNA